MPVAKLVFQIRMCIKHHQRTFPLSVSHKIGYAQFWGNTNQHVYMIRHQMAFVYFDAFVLTELPEYFPETFSVLIVNDLSSILRSKHDMVFAHPFRAR